MSDSSKKSEPGPAVKTRGMSNMETRAEAVLERQRGYLEARFDKLQQMEEDTEAKLGAIQTDLISLTGIISPIKGESDKLQSDVGSNSGRLATQKATLETMQLKLADMEDRGRCCNIHAIGIPEGIEGSNAVQFLTESLSKWFPTLSRLEGKIMRAHRVYSDNNRKKSSPAP